MIKYLKKEIHKLIYRNIIRKIDPLRGLDFNTTIEPEGIGFDPNGGVISSFILT
jgi:hypothetical protein